MFQTENFSLKSTRSICGIKIKMKFAVEKTVELKQKENNYFILYLNLFAVFWGSVWFKHEQDKEQTSGSWTDQVKSWMSFSSMLQNVPLHICPKSFPCIFKKYLCIYLAASGLDCVLQDLSLWWSDSVTVACGLSGCTACGTLGPWSGMESWSSALQGRFFTPGPPGKSPFPCILPWAVKWEEYRRAPPPPLTPIPDLRTTAKVHACVISVKTEGHPPPWT